MKHEEFRLQKAVCRYLDMQFPRTLYMSDTIANVKLTIPQAKRNKAIQKQGFKCPDLIILEPKKGYCGLFLELKIKSPYKKNGEIYSNKHLQGQLNSIEDLRKKGYKAEFAWSFEQSRKIIDEYLK